MATLGFDCDQYGCLGVMTLNGTVALNTPAWDLTGYPKLWVEHTVVTDSTVLALSPGQRSYPSRLNQSEYDLTLYVNGDVNQNGVPYADPWVGLYTNLQYLWTNVFQPVTTGAGTHSAVLTTPTGGSLSAAVKFSELRGADDIENPRFAEYRTTLVIPAGRFA